jgi:hypothetical protein
MEGTRAVQLSVLHQLAHRYMTGMAIAGKATIVLTAHRQWNVVMNLSPTQIQKPLTEETSGLENTLSLTIP